MDSDLTIANIIDGLPRLRVFDEELKAYEIRNPFKSDYSLVDKNTYLGIEVEIENINFFSKGSPYWNMVDDGSLRNNGKEFITPPIRAFQVEQALDTLFNKELNPTAEFSERTSIHVHMNIRTLTIEQLETLVATYILFEKSLFNFVGENRYNNVFCVPLGQTTMGHNLRTLIIDKNPMVEWMKYTALNLLPVGQKGTIEFRHLHGTKDIAKIMTWINLILCLKKFALRKSPEYLQEKISTLNTSSLYRMFAEEVFGEYLHHIFTDTFNQDVEEGVSFVKEQCLTNNFLQEIRNSTTKGTALYEISRVDLNRYTTRNEIATPRERFTFSVNSQWPVRAVDFSDHPDEEEPEEEWDEEERED